MKTLWRLREYSFRYGWRLAISYVCMLASMSMAMTIPIVIGMVIDDMLEQGVAVATIVRFSAIVLALAIGSGFLGYFQRWMSESTSHRAAADLRNDFYDGLLYSSFQFHGQQRVGESMAIGTSDIEVVQDFMSVGVIAMLNMFVFVGIFGGLMLAVDWQFGLISISGILVWFIRSYHGRTAGAEKWGRVQERVGGLTTILQESMVSIRIVRAFGVQKSAVSKFRQASNALSDDLHSATTYNLSRTGSLIALYNLGLALLIWYGMVRISAGAITPGHLATFILMLEVSTEHFGYGLHYIMKLLRVIASGRRVLSAMDRSREARAVSVAIGATDERVSGRIEFVGVSSEYEPGAPVVSDLSFEISPHEVVAILGTAGSGKSTIASLIPRFYEVSRGRITVAGADLRDIPLPVLRRSVGIVLQDSFMFSGTVRDNIAFGKVDLGMEEIEAAARIAHIHEFVAQLPNGYETMIGERGITLSGGQRQRIAIARVVVQDPPILIFDDSTSNVDFETEHRIQEAIARISRDKATLIVTHRVSTARIADNVLVLDRGRIVEQGTYPELMASGRYFRQINEIQSATLIEDVLADGQSSFTDPGHDR